MDTEKLKALKKQANALKPIIIIGQNGITDSVIAEIDRALYDHELIKIRINASDHFERQEFVGEILSRTQCELVNTIGHVASFYRYSSKDKD